MTSFYCFKCSWTKWRRWLNIRFYLSISDANRRNKEGICVQDFLMLTKRYRSFPSVLLRGRWCDLVCGECLQMIKSMGVGFCSLRDWCYSGDWVCNLRTVAHFLRLHPLLVELQVPNQDDSQFAGFWSVNSELWGINFAIPISSDSNTLLKEFVTYFAYLNLNLYPYTFLENSSNIILNRRRSGNIAEISDIVPFLDLLYISFGIVVCRNNSTKWSSIRCTIL